MCITLHRLFPLKADHGGSANVARKGEVFNHYHNIFGHLNLKSLMHLSEKQMVTSLPVVT